MYRISVSLEAFTLVCLMVLLMVAQDSYAQVSMALPGVGGEYVEDYVAGQLVMPGSASGRETHLVITGNMVPGTFWSCDRDRTVPYGSEVHLFIYFGTEGFDLASANAELPSNEGAFKIEVPLVSFLGSPIDLFSAQGTLDFEIYIGYHPDGTVLCYVYNPGLVTIETAQLEASEAVSSEAASWGSVKSLYR